MADNDERFRLQMIWLRDDQGNLIAEARNGNDSALEDLDGVIYFSDLETGSPHDAILLLAAEDIHNTTLRRVELTFLDMRIVLERTDEPATLGDRAQSVTHKEISEKTPVPVGTDGVVRWH